MLMLAVDIYKERRELSKVTACNRSIINPGPVFSCIADYAAKKNAVIFYFNSMKRKPL